ncbi:MAG: ABC transporter permease [Acidobacteriia bacterium]|nr:ABC transporter permease [Terriglobia bacterium]
MNQTSDPPSSSPPFGEGRSVEAWPVRTAGQILRDLRYGLRTVVKNPAFSAIAVLTLALGIGANTAIFTVTNALLLRPLPYGDSSRLVYVYAARADAADQAGPFSYPRFTLLRDANRSFSGLAAFSSEVFNLTGRGDPEQIPSARVSWNFFNVLGVKPLLGRTFIPGEGQPGGKEVALISHSLWRRFGSDPEVIGQTVTLDSRAYTIVGVLPGDYAFNLIGPNVDIWVPREFELNLATPERIQAGTGYLDAVGRLRDGVTPDQAQSEMNVLTERYRKDNPTKADADPKLTIQLKGVEEALVENFRPALFILLGAVGLVLLIACANVASLLLSRALARKREIAVRTALGASRTTIVRQLLTETLVLAFLGGAAGILVASTGTALLSILGRGNLPATTDLRMDWRVLTFTAIISLLSGAFFGLMPALHMARTDVSTVLHDEGRGSIGSRSRSRVRSLLVVSQVALSLVLLVCSGLLIRSFTHLLTAYPGFDASNVLTVQMALPPARYGTAAQINAFYNETLRRMSALPGVEAATISSALPVTPSRFSPVLVEGQPVVPLAERPILSIQTISPDYTKVMRTPLLGGRQFTAHDDAHAPPVALVNEALRRRFWPNENPVGKRLWLGRQTGSTEVVGVLGNEKNISLTADPNPEVFLPFLQLPWASLNLSVRTEVEPHSIVSAVRREVSMIDKDQPMTKVQTMEELLDSARSASRFTMFLLGVFAGTALVLAVVGIYGVVAYTVTQRTQEIGIRLALGATPRDILRLVLDQGLILAVSGIGIGLAVSWALTRTMKSLLFEITATDPITFIASACLFTAVALLASYRPARRAMRIDPAGALRAE